MAPSISEMAKEDTPIIGIKSTLTISLALPKICKPAVTAVKIVPALHGGGVGVSKSDLFPPIKQSRVNHIECKECYLSNLIIHVQNLQLE
jgi:hypothetical protein